MANNLLQVILNTLSGLPEDRVINTYSFLTAEEKDVPTAVDIETVLLANYEAFSSIASPTLVDELTFKWYDRADSMPRVPWRTQLEEWTGGGGIALPSEVALVQSFKAASVSGVAAARRRGRVFLGPLRQAAAGGGFNGDRPSSGTLTTVASMGVNLIDASQAAADWTWQVWSTVDSVGREVVEGWVDNAWDTQRRRGPAATERVIFTPS